MSKSVPWTELVKIMNLWCGLTECSLGNWDVCLDNKFNIRQIQITSRRPIHRLERITTWVSKWDDTLSRMWPLLVVGSGDKCFQSELQGTPYKGRICLCKCKRNDDDEFSGKLNKIFQKKYNSERESVLQSECAIDIDGVRCLYEYSSVKMFFSLSSSFPSD